MFKLSVVEGQAKSKIPKAAKASKKSPSEAAGKPKFPTAKIISKANALNANKKTETGNPPGKKLDVFCIVVF